VHQHVGTAVLVEEFVAGREIYVAVLGNERLQVLPPFELVIEKLGEDEPLIATEKVKHDPKYQEERGVTVVRAKLTDEQLRRLERIARRGDKTLELSGYARLDFRMRADGEFFFLEANPNPEIADGEEVASSAEAAGMGYLALLEKIIRLGIRASRH